MFGKRGFTPQEMVALSGNIIYIVGNNYSFNKLVNTNKSSSSAEHGVMILCRWAHARNRKVLLVQEPTNRQCGSESRRAICKDTVKDVQCG